MARAHKKSDVGSDDDYHTSLKELMQSCLPAILVEIVDLRPNDPVQYLAHALYRFREKEAHTTSQVIDGSSVIEVGPQMNNRLNNDINLISGPTCPVGKRLSEVNIPSTSARTVETLAVGNRNRDVKIMQAGDDPYVDDICRSMEEIGTITQTLLHQAEQSVMQAIGDIFDDNDFT